MVYVSTGMGDRLSALIVFVMDLGFLYLIHEKGDRLLYSAIVMIIMRVPCENIIRACTLVLLMSLWLVLVDRNPFRPCFH